ncbi:tetratricopeptide repeat protein [Maridesulfovibrio sp. FT414]|uniref:tetratricopeptide repeat protein n=1 Tax=Maridesulfovibrio sp. FT414 TaxID=2979469 RepID=UPI003D8064A4
MSERELKTIDDLRELSAQADKLAAAEKKDECLELLREGLKAAKEIDPAYELFFESEICHYQNDYDQAIDLLEKAISISPSDDFLLTSLGVNYLFVDSNGKAIELFNKAIEINPNDPKAWAQKGVSYSEMGDHKKAIELYDKAIEINPKYFNAWRQKGVSYAKMGDEKKAIELYDKAIEINPKDHKAWRQKGVCYAIMGDREKAIELYDKALEINPKDFDAWRDKGVNYAKMGDKNKALELYDKAIEINPKDHYAWREKGLSLYSLKKYPESIECLKEACELAPNNFQYASELEYIKTKSRSPNKTKNKKSEQSSTTCQTPNKNAGQLAAFVDDARKKFKDDIDEFKNDMGKTETLINQHIEALPPIRKDKSLFFVLRKWNSYTPILSGINGDDSVGGGYFLFHKGEGVVIDPGYNFIDNFHRAGLRIADIKHIVITHAHNDHTVDFESLLSLFFKFNQKRPENDKHDINFYLNVSSMNKLNSLLDFRSKHQKVHPISANQIFTLTDGLEMRILPAYHNDTIAERYAVGIHFKVTTEAGERNIVLTADTGLLPPIKKRVDEQTVACVDPTAKEIWQLYEMKRNKTDLLVPHIGSIKPNEFDVDIDKKFDELFYPNHLGVMGTLRVITSLQPELAVVSEFGEELKDFRPKLMELLSEVTKEHCESNGCERINVIPGDLPFVYDITQKSVYCVLSECFIPAANIRFREVHLNEGEETFTYYDKGHKQSNNERKIRTATEEFMKACKIQEACYFKEKD